jgi:hypothetical protein
MILHDIAILFVIKHFLTFGVGSNANKSLNMEDRCDLQVFQCLYLDDLLYF